MANSKSWEKIVKNFHILDHNFSSSPFALSAAQIKKSVQGFRSTGEKEVRILCKQDTRESRPEVFRKNDLFIVPVKNGYYNIIKGEGYIDIPEITSEPITYQSKLPFILESSEVGNSEMQHLDYAYAVSLIRTFTSDDSLVLTIRGRKYTPSFTFISNGQEIVVDKVQTEVDAGYEGKDKIVLVEAKNFSSTNVIIRQLYYPYRQWQISTQKDVTTLFFEKQSNFYLIWKFEFTNPQDYNSIKLVKSARYKIE